MQHAPGNQIARASTAVSADTMEHGTCTQLYTAVHTTAATDAQASEDISH